MIEFGDGLKDGGIHQQLYTRLVVVVVVVVLRSIQKRAGHSTIFSILRRHRRSFEQLHEYSRALVIRSEHYYCSH